jgi:hypothetical protein
MKVYFSSIFSNLKKYKPIKTQNTKFETLNNYKLFLQEKL